MSQRSTSRAAKVYGTPTTGNAAVFGAPGELKDGGFPAGTGISTLTNEVTAGPGSGSQVALVQNPSTPLFLTDDLTVRANRALIAGYPLKIESGNKITVADTGKLVVNGTPSQQIEIVAVGKQVNMSATLVVDDTLFYQVEANTNWRYDLSLFITTETDANVDITGALSIPANATTTAHIFSYQTGATDSNTTNITSFLLSTTPSTLSRGTIAIASAPATLFYMVGVINIGATAGWISGTWRQTNATEGSYMIRHPGSRLTLTRIS